MNRFIVIILSLAFSIPLNSVPLRAQELVFDFNTFANCARLAASPRDCIGIAAQTCMHDTPGGDSTVGMGACFNAEFQAWDDSLNATYRELRSVLARSDAENAASGFRAPSQADAVQQMQRAWIPYRDDKCAFVRSLWGGGTGGSPAALECLLHETAAQALYLGDMLATF